MTLDADGANWVLLAGCGVVLAAYGWTLVRYRTAILGLNALNLFACGSATLSAFVFGTLFDQMPAAFGPDHLEVVSYSVIGLFAMVAGVHLAWLPLLDRGRQTPRATLFPQSLINRRVGWLTFVVGSGAELMIPFTATLPTVSTAVYGMATLARIGLGILLVAAINEERWDRFGLALLISLGLSLVGSLSSGFSFIRVTTLLPLIAIWLASAGVNFKNALKVALLLPAALLIGTAAGSAWLATRGMIRSGSLEHLSVIDQASAFMTEYWSNLSLPTRESVMGTISERVDMTNILAAQVRYQPAGEPYAHGGTVLSSFYTLIPRALWPQKPVVAGGSEFVSRFTGLTWDESTSVGLPYPFELFANGGPVLVVLGLGVLGYCGARLELNLTNPRMRLGSFWALALATATLTEGGQRTEVVLPAIVSSAAVAYVFGSLIERFFDSSATPVTDPEIHGIAAEGWTHH